MAAGFRRPLQEFFNAVLIILITSSTVSTSPLQKEQRAAFDCKNPGAVFDTSCWKGLDIPKYLADPTTGKYSPWSNTAYIKLMHIYQGWIHSTPNCTADTAAGTDCCEADEPWSTCFIRLGRGLAGSDCSVINAQQCTWDNELGPNLSPSQQAQVRYVLKNIYAINDFFTTYYSGL